MRSGGRGGRMAADGGVGRRQGEDGGCMKAALAGVAGQAAGAGGVYELLW